MAAIKLIRRIINVTSADVYGREDQGQVVFRDTDTSLDMFLPLSAENNSVIMHCLSQHFIKHCGITVAKYQALIRPILDYPLSEVNKLLEEQNLDDVGNTYRSPVPESVFGYDGSGNAHSAGDTVTAVEEQTPGSFNHFFAGSDVPSPAKSMSLRERIPTLDQTIALVRDAAVTANTASLSITAVSESRRHAGRGISGNSNDADQFSNSGIGNTPTSPRNPDTAEESSGAHTRSLFNLDSLCSALPNEPSADVPHKDRGRRQAIPSCGKQEQVHLGISLTQAMKTPHRLPFESMLVFLENHT